MLTSFISAGVLVRPPMGWRSDRLGSHNLFIGATAMFILSSKLRGTATLEGEVGRQAGKIAYRNNFNILFWLLLCLAPLCFAPKRPKPTTGRAVIHAD